MFSFSLIVILSHRKGMVKELHGFAKHLSANLARCQSPVLQRITFPELISYEIRVKLHSGHGTREWWVGGRGRQCANANTLGTVGMNKKPPAERGGAGRCLQIL